jgi:hypothetical protein
MAGQPLMREQFRRTIQRGTVVYATVEEYHGGLATVRLTGGGNRLTNLSTLGATVTVGERVTVDYSQGITPIVRPLLITEYNPEDDGLDIAPLVLPEDKPVIIPEELPESPNPPQEIDLTWAATGFGWWSSESEPEELQYDGQMHIGFGVWSPVPHVENYYDEAWAILWDNCNATDKTFKGRDYTVVPRAGKYMIWGGFWWWAYWNAYIYSPETTGNLSPQDGHYELAITKNGTIIAHVTTRDMEYYSQNRLYQMIATIDDFQAGDQIQLQAYQTVLYPWYSEMSGIGWLGIQDPFYYGKWMDYEYNELRACLIPGTQGA